MKETIKGVRIMGIKGELDIDGFEEYITKPVIKKAIRIEWPFEVDTLEGKRMKGKAGDYLVKGIKGELYPVDKEIFHLTYTKKSDITDYKKLYENHIRACDM